MGGFRRPGRGGEVFTPWWLSGLSGGGRGGCNPPPPPLGFLVGEIKPASSWTTWIREGGGGGRDPRARAAAQIGHFCRPGRQNPRLASPRTRPERPEKAGGMGGQSFSTPPLFPGLLGPLEAATGGLAGEGRTPRSGPRLGTPRPHTFPPPGGPPPPASPCGVYAGIPGDPPQLHARRPPLRALPMREAQLSRKWGPAPPAEGASGRPPPPKC